MNGDTKVLDAAWRSYSEHVLSPHASDVQRMECRRAFYAGASALYGWLMTALDPGRDPTEADLARMTSIHDELHAFCRAVMRGEA